MAEIKPFGALRFQEKAGSLEQLVCPPYDIISEEERRGYLARNPRNIIRLELPREGEDPYREAGETLRAWLREGILACDPQPGLYIYEEEFEALGTRRSVKGLVCLVKLEEFEKGIVLPHEETLSKAKDDRFKLMCATGCNLSSIYSLYFDERGDIYPRLAALSEGEPDVRFRTGDGIEHRVWRVCGRQAVGEIATAFADRRLYIADGHHRYETALNYRNHLRARGEESGGANYVMMTLMHMEHPGLLVFPTHRVVRGLEAFSLQKLLEGCKAYFDLSDCPAGEAESRIGESAKRGGKAMALYCAGKATVLELRDTGVMAELLPQASPALRQLDVSILHTLVLERLLGIDKENMANQKNLVYTRDAAEAMAAVDAGKADCAFLINPTAVEEIAAVAGAGEKMPQKSTYFYPKLITGHLMNRF